jgi:hypothetical protein
MFQRLNGVTAKMGSVFLKVRTYILIFEKNIDAVPAVSLLTLQNVYSLPLIDWNSTRFHGGWQRRFPFEF